MNTKYWEGYPHAIDIRQFGREWLERDFLPLANGMRDVVSRGGCDILRGKKMVSFFYEPSTRTRMSFEFAMRYLGGNVWFSSENAGEFSSAKKGETLEDTMRVINRYRPDAIVLRYNKDIGSEFAAKVSAVPIINAGDREPGQHPTQALLDIMTISMRRSIDGLKIAMVGDLDKGRTVRSLSYLLGKFRNIEIYYVSPVNTRMKSDVKDYLTKHGIYFEELLDLREVASKVDIVYQTRAQIECGTTIDRSQGYFIIDQTILDLLPRNATIMHPLPRKDEITSDVDKDPRAVYLTDQIDCGLLTRMALLKMILNP